MDQQQLDRDAQQEMRIPDGESDRRNPLREHGGDDQPDQRGDSAIAAQIFQRAAQQREIDARSALASGAWRTLSAAMKSRSIRRFSANSR